MAWLWREQISVTANAAARIARKDPILVPTLIPHPLNDSEVPHTLLLAASIVCDFRHIPW
jgi:hypothetical protein